MGIWCLLLVRATSVAEEQAASSEIARIEMVRHMALVLLQECLAFP